jgi:hypothetical protein
MPYGLILLLLCIGLSFHYVAVADASARAKGAVGSTVVASMLIAWLHPRWSVLALVLQIAASTYVLLYYRLHGSREAKAIGGRTGRRSG